MLLCANDTTRGGERGRLSGTRGFYYPYSASRQSVANLPTDRLFTGQRLDGSTGLYDYGARLYDGQLGRFISPDAVGIDITNPQSLNRYSYTLNNPLKYVDPSGRLPVVPLLIAGVVLVSKAVDYGWTAWDAWQSTQVINDPNASHQAKQEAQMNMFLIGSTELADPGNLSPISLPTDDLARHGLLSLLGTVRHSMTHTEIKQIAKESAHLGSGNVTVLGHFKPKSGAGYIEVAKQVGGTYFDMPPGVWDKLSKEERWSVNRRFLDDAIARGDRFRLATRLEDEASAFAEELRYLKGKSYHEVEIDGVKYWQKAE